VGVLGVRVKDVTAACLDLIPYLVEVLIGIFQNKKRKEEA
jgi:hypothetical protein